MKSRTVKYSSSVTVSFYPFYDADAKTGKDWKMSPTVEVYQHRQDLIGPWEEAKVNWSCFGAQSPDDAKQYARGIIAAATKARMLNKRIGKL